jgi:ABC-2 type transport system ATP-binding protein
MADPDQAALLAIPGTESVEVRGETVLLHASDSDAVARYLLTQTPARDMEITTRGLEDAFIALTSDDADESSTTDGGQR